MMKSMTVNWGNGADIRLALNTNQTASTKEAHGLAMEVVSGSVWLTFEGTYQDYVLSPGERLPINVRGRIVIQGLAPSEVMFVRQVEVQPRIRAGRDLTRHPGDCWRNFVGGLSTGRLNIDSPI